MNQPFLNPTLERERKQKETIFQAARGAVREQREGSFPGRGHSPQGNKAQFINLSHPCAFVDAWISPGITQAKQMGLRRAFLLDPPVLQGLLHQSSGNLSGYSQWSSNSSKHTRITHHVVTRWDKTSEAQTGNML